jgi:hypothetical protein
LDHGLSSFVPAGCAGEISTHSAHFGALVLVYAITGPKARRNRILMQDNYFERFTKKKAVKKAAKAAHKCCISIKIVKLLAPP